MILTGNDRPGKGSNLLMVRRSGIHAPRNLNAMDMENLRIPRNYWGACLSAIPSTVKTVVQEYVNSMPTLMDRGVGLTISGPASSGKTSAAVYILKYARATGYSGFFLPVAGDLFDRAQLKELSDIEGQPSLLDRILEVDLLVIDDITENTAGALLFRFMPFDDIVKKRFAERRPTIITSRQNIYDSKNVDLYSIGRIVNDKFIRVVTPNIQIKDKEIEEIITKFRGLQ